MSPVRRFVLACSLPLILWASSASAQAPVSCGDRCPLSTGGEVPEGPREGATLRPAPLDGSVERWISFLRRSTTPGFESIRQIWLQSNTCGAFAGNDNRPLLWDASIYPSISYYDPAWSTDGRYLAYVQDSANSSSIYIQEYQLSLNIDEAIVAVGAPRLVVAGGPGVSNRHPAWRPDGLELAFDSNASGISTDLYTISVDPGGPPPVPPPSPVRRTFSDNRAEETPAYSPDGRRLAFSTNLFGPRVIEILDLGTGQISLAEANFAFVSHTNPRWSSDGRAILYNAPEGEYTFGPSRIWCLVPATQSKQQVPSSSPFDAGLDVSHRTNFTGDGTLFNYIVFTSVTPSTPIRAEAVEPWRAVTCLSALLSNRVPTANAGGPYTGSPGTAINFDGTGSSDPDGDRLYYTWDFGDGYTGLGAAPMHTYSTQGVYKVTLGVIDPYGAHDEDSTTATIQSVVSADILLENGGSTLDVRKTGNRGTKVGLEETVLPYTDLIPSTIRTSTTFPNSGFVTDCTPDLRTFVMGDLNGNGVPDIDIRFSNKCLANLFNNVPDNTVATIVITGQFSEPGGMVPLNAQRDLTIRAKHRDEQIMAVAYPNPFNPGTVISYTVMKAGAVTMRIYSIDGRLVSTLKQGEATEPGTYEVTWNGTDDAGRHLSSGIYFLKTSQKAGAAEESSVLKLVVTK